MDTERSGAWDVEKRLGVREERSDPSVLWVDSSPEQRAFCLRALESAGLRPAVARSCVEAHRRAAHDPPCLIVLALEGIEGDTAEGWGQFKSRFPDTPLAAFGNPQQLAESLPGIPAIDLVLPWTGDEEKFLLSLKGPLRLSRIIQSISAENSQLRRSSLVDFASGALNRRATLERLDTEFKRALRNGEPLSCLSMEPDRIEDLLAGGPPESEEVILREVARSVRATVRETDVLGRLGNREFLLVLPNTPGSGARRLAQRLTAATQAHLFNLHGQSVWVTVAMGASSTTDQRVSAGAHLLELASRELRHALKAEIPGREDQPIPVGPNGESAEAGEGHAPEKVETGQPARPAPTRSLVLATAATRAGLWQALEQAGFEPVAADGPDQLLEGLAAGGADLAIIEDLSADGQAPDLLRTIRSQAGVGYTPILWVGETAPPATGAGGHAPDDWLPPHLIGDQLAWRLKALLRQKRLNESLLKARRRSDVERRGAEESDRLQRLGQIAGELAVELSNTLSGILSRSELLRARAKGEADLRDLDRIEHAALDSAEKIRRLLAFSRKTSPARYEPLDLAAVLDESLALTRSRQDGSAQPQAMAHEVVRDIERPLIIRGRAPELREMFVNLIRNALEAMPRGGRLGVTARAENGQAVIQISDTGEGIPPGDRWRVFDPFFTTKGEEHSGLGLSLVVGAASRHGGTVEVDSAPGCGSAFSVTLPLLPQAALEGQTGVIQAPEGPLSSPSTQPSVSLRLLMVDDDPCVRGVFAAFLEDSGHEIHLAANGRQAQEKLDAEGPFDVMFTDLDMPDISGSELAEWARQANPRMTVVLMSGWTADQCRESGRADHADYVMSKPVSLLDLLALLQEIQGPEAGESLGAAP